MSTPPAGREGVSFHASPLLIGSGVAACASTLLLAIVWFLDAAPTPGPPPGQGQPPPPPPANDVLDLLMGVCVATWIAVLVAICRDQVIRRINEVGRDIIAATREYGEQRETEGYLKALRSEPAPGTSGDVVPFPRQPSPPEGRGG